MLPDPSLHRPHIGYAIGRSVGGAVTRNRIRRRLRALFAESGDRLRPGWYVVGASPQAATCPSPRLRHDVETVLTKLAKVGV
jgi:ribonuclease P protein component